MGHPIVFLGGCLEAALRLGINHSVARVLGIAFPHGTLLINISGSFIMGLVAVLRLQRRRLATPRLFLPTGILGAYTTFSAFSLDVALLYKRGKTVLAAIYLLASVAISIASLFAGLALVRNFA